MSKIAKFLILSSALLYSQVVNAEPPTGTFVGGLHTYTGLTFNCTLTIDIDSSGTSATIALSPGNAMCLLIVFDNSPLISPPYQISFTEGPVGSGTFAIHNVEVSAWGGTCQGDITGTWEGTTLDIVTTLPAKAGGPDCSFDGLATKID